MPDFDERLWLIAGALILDAMIGDPPWLWRRVPHPAALMGQLIGFCDRHLNKPALTNLWALANGTFTLLGLIIFFGAVGLALNALFMTIPYGLVFELIVVAILVAQKSLYTHVLEVMRALEIEGLPKGRRAVSRIVGRDPHNLDETGIARAAIESLSENFSDGIVAPVLFYSIGGLPGILIYKAVNTADSMIGYRNEKYRQFGWAAARTDDVLNYLPARLSAALIALSALLSGQSFVRSLTVMFRDAAKHSSPNAGWPESAMAGALNIALGGPRTYGSVQNDAAWLNESGKRDAVSGDVSAALSLFLVACGLQLALIFALSAVFFA